MQDHLLHPLLTVEEAMSFCINLKIGKELSDEEKADKVGRDMLICLSQKKSNVDEKNEIFDILHCCRSQKSSLILVYTIRRM